jgi:hypothetical protein
MLYRHQPRRRHSSAYTRPNPIVALMFCGIVTAGFAHSQSVGTKNPPPTGSIQGLVLNPTGEPVPGAMIWAIRTFSTTLVSAPIMVSVNTDTKGTYTFPALAPGSYRICVGAEGAMLLDPCSWSMNPPIWNLESGQSATLNIPLMAGAFVHVRVDDPSGAMTKLEQSSKGSALIVSGALSSGQRIHFLEVVTEATGRTFRALVPVGNSVQVQLGTALSVKDALGNSVTSLATPGAITTPVAVSGSATEQTVRLAVQ